MVVRLFSLILLIIPSMVLSEVGFRDLIIGSDRSVIDENCSNMETFYQCYEIDDIKFNFTVGEVKQHTFDIVGDGYKDLIVGNKLSSVFYVCKTKDNQIWDCYGNVKVKFGLDVTEISSITLLNVDKFGNFVDFKETLSSITIDLGPVYQTILDNIIGDPNNPYTKLKKSLGSKYQLDWEFTERDRKLFNENEKDSLWTSYEGGQIFSQILREDNYSDLRLLVHYLTKEDGEKLSEERKPQNVNFDDF